MTASLDIQSCLGKRSGVGTFIYETAKHLTDDDEISFRGNVFNFLNRWDGQLAALELPCRFNECNKLPYSAYRLSQTVSLLPYSAIFGGADVNLFYNYVVPAGVRGKVITTVYDMTYKRFPETMHRRNLCRLSSQMDKTLDRCDRIITISEFSKREIVSLLRVPEDMISVVGCAAECGGSAADFSEVAAKFAISAPYILYVGNIEPRKNLERLLRAFERLKSEAGIPHALVLAGGAGWRNEGILHEAQSMAHGDDVIFTGYVSEAEKRALYDNAAIFVYPSLYEGFGIPPLEAMQRGCAVVCSDAASLPEVVGDAAVCVDAYSETAIAEGMYRLLSDEALRTALIEKGYAQAEKFSWQSTADKIKSICKTVI